MSELPRGWASTTFGDIAETQLGKMLSAKARTGNGGRPYLRNKNVQWGRIDLDDLRQMDFTDEELDKFRLHPGDLLVCEGGEVGRAAIWRGTIAECAYQKALHRIRPRGGIFPEYLLYLLMHYASTHAFERYVTGSTIAHLPQEDLRMLPVPLPPLAEQRRIVAAVEEHLSRLDGAAASLHVASTRTEAMVAAATVVALRRDWPLVQLRDVTVKQEYGTSTKAVSEGDIPVLRMGNLRDGEIDYRDLKYLPPGHSDGTRFCLTPGDLLFNRTNSSELVGKTAVFKGADGPVAFASYLIRVRLSGDCLPDWAALVINSPLGRSYIAGVRTQQVGQANVNGTKLAATPIPLPPVETQQKLLADVDAYRQRARQLRHALEVTTKRSDSLRCSILARAFRGELVQQDPNEASARALLEQIAEHRATEPRPMKKRRKSVTA